jgi:outer membrane receptor protein involved in Fe transport
MNVRSVPTLALLPVCLLPPSVLVLAPSAPSAPSPPRALASVSSALAQTNKGGISGTVVDASGAVVPGAAVLVTNIGTNESLQLVTSMSGVYAATSLEPVEYRVAVELSGFRKVVIDRVKVDTGTTATVNVTLAPAGLESQVVVTATVPLLNVGSGTLGQTITARQITDVPLNNRSVLDLAITVPNVTGDVGSEDPVVASGATVPGFNLSLNGGRPGSTAILADGVNNTGVGLARAIVSFSPETVQEFTVQTSAYSAEFGETGGGVINVTTKSGTNRLSGTALWYHRDPRTNAAPFTTSVTNRPPNNLRTDQVSFAAGGAVVLPKYDGHDRTFFFVAVEPRWRQDFLQQTTLLPTDAMRAGDFSNLARVRLGWAPADIVSRFGVPVTGPSTIYQQFNLVGNQLQQIPLATGQSYMPFPGNKIPANMLDPTSVKALDFLPHAGESFINGDGDLVNAVINRFVRQDEVRYLTRIDHALSSRNHLSGRYTIIPAVGQKGFGSDINGNGADYSYAQQVFLSDTHVFSSNVLNDLRVDYTRGTFSSDYTPEFAIKTGRNLNTELGLPSLTTGGMPLLEYLDGWNAFSAIGSAGSTNNYNIEQRYKVSDVISWNSGAMSWKFGGDFGHDLLDVIPFFGAAGGRYDFRVVQTSASGGTATGQGGNSFASYLLGVPQTVLIRSTLIPYDYRWTSSAAFVQNDWKVRPDLTLNLGLRYSLQLPRTEKNNLQGVFMPELAKQVPLATPVTLADGTVVTSALVPPFAYAGRGGRSQYVFPIQWLNFEPRLGFAWSLTRSAALRGGYGISHVPLTGNNRLPNPDFGATQNLGANSGQLNSSFAMRLSSNQPKITPLTPDEALSIPSDGLVYLNSINIPGFAISQNTKIPSLQNWNVTLSRELGAHTILEVGYAGSKGTDLFTPRINLNPLPFTYLDALAGANRDPLTMVPDPLGRTDVLGRVVMIPQGTLGSQFLGFNHLDIFYNAIASSSRHAAYVSLNRRLADGLSFTANYTYGRSTDNASDASPDKNVLTTGATAGHVTFGAPLSADQAISTYDIAHTASATIIYDLPFGRDRQFLATRLAPLRWVAGNWTVAGLLHLQGDYPFLPTVADPNRLSADQTHTVRPDLVPGVSLVNPLWDRNCPVGNTCEPYINPSAFIRPLKGQLGNAPRTLDVRGPLQRYIDLSFQKDFMIGASRRRLQFRVDMINAFNHPNFRTNVGNSGTDLFGSLPIETPITASEYDSWARSNGKPLSTTAEGLRLMTQVQQQAIGSQLPSGALPADFFHVRLPQRFATTGANTFDITSIDGYKLYRLRQAYGQGFGQLVAVNNPRYIQIGLKIFF